MSSLVYSPAAALSQDRYNRLVDQWNAKTGAERVRGATDCIHAGCHHWRTIPLPGYRVCLHCLRYEPIPGEDA